MSDKSQRQDGTASTALSLLDLLHQTPRLAEVLLRDPKTANALCRTNRTARAVVHNHVTAIRVLEPNGYGTRYQVQAMEKLLNCNWLYLQKLDIKYRAKLSEEAVAVLSQASWSLLTTLNMSRNGLDSYAVHYLIQGKWPHLCTLDLSHNPLGSQGIKWLREAQWPLLQNLMLNDVQLNDDAAKEVAQIDWPQLRHLELCYNQLGSDTSFVAEAQWRGLSTLDLSNNGLHGVSLASLDRDKLPSLQRLRLAHNSISDAELLQLASAQCSQLTHLDLSNCYICDPVLGMYPNLRWLSLAHNCLTPSDDMLMHLATGAPLLAVLDLSDTSIEFVDIQKLVSLHWPELVELHVHDNQLECDSLDLLSTSCCARVSDFSEGLNSTTLPASYVGPWPKMQSISVYPE